MQRREVLGRGAWGITGAALAACGGGNAADDSKRNFLFVHGAWHCAGHWNRISVRLAAMGHRVAAIDLPGAGLNASYPASFLSGDQAALATELSPLAAITLDDYRDAVVDQVRSQAAHGPVTLVAHSMGGMTATVVGEAIPELLARIVYVTALVPVRLKNVLEYGSRPEWITSLTGTLFYADPAAVGAARINPRSPSTADRDKMRQVLYGDIDMADYERFGALIAPDVPIQVASGDGRGTAQRWGRVPRTFVRCLRDRSQPLAGQDLLIADADALTPNNKFDVRTLDSSHSPFASRPAELAALLDTLP